MYLERFLDKFVKPRSCLKARNHWDLFSQNERQVARELKEIWLTKHLNNQENKGISQGNGFWTPNKAATMTYSVSF